ncbi:MAG: SOS cell division inhibitor [Pseudomonadota bacterium]
MADSQALLEQLDNLKAELDAALEAQDWDALVELNARIKPAVEPLMVALENKEMDPAEVRERLEALNEFVEAADKAAVKAREEARESLQGVSQNRSAARAYQNVSSGRPK